MNIEFKVMKKECYYYVIKLMLKFIRLFKRKKIGVFGNREYVNDNFVWKYCYNNKLYFSVKN